MDQKIVVVANRKGGVGKTTIVFNLAHALVQAGKRVVIIDLDSQGNVSGLCKAGVLSLDEFKAAKVQDVCLGLQIVAATKEIGRLEAEVNNLIDRNLYMDEDFLPKLKAQGEWDFLLIDTPPALSLLNVNAFCVADLVVIPLNGDMFSLEGLAETKDVLARVKHINSKIRYKTAVNEYNGGRVLGEAVIEKVKADSGWAGVLIPAREHFNRCNAVKANALDDKEIKICFEKLVEVVING